MSSTLATRIEALDDKQASHLAMKLGSALLGKWKDAPTLPALATWADDVFASQGAPLGLAHSATWSSEKLRGIQAGDAARLLLSTWAGDPELAPVVTSALEHYPPDQKADLGVFSVPIAIGLTYVLITGDVDVDLGFIKIKKKGLSPADQKAIGPQFLSALLALIRPAAKGG